MMPDREWEEIIKFHIGDELNHCKQKLFFLRVVQCNSSPKCQ